MRSLAYACATAFLVTCSTTNAAIVTFDDLVTGPLSQAFDGDGDGIDDVVFSTTDPDGLNNIGPGDTVYIDEPGLEGTVQLSPDLSVSFLNGASGSLSFGFALLAGPADVDGVLFSIFDAADTLIASDFVLADTDNPGGGGGFPEEFVSVSFPGVAAYATFDFTNNSATRYIIDNFQGTYGSTETVVPIPAASWLFASGLGYLWWIRRRGM